MSISQSYLELNDVFVTLQKWKPSEINQLYDGQWANYTHKIHQLFQDIWIKPVELDEENCLFNYTDYLRFTKNSSYDEISKPARLREYDYMLPYPSDLWLLLKLIKEMVFSSQTFQKNDFMLFNRIVEFIHHKIGSKNNIEWYADFILDIQKLYPIIESTFQKPNRSQTQLMYSLRNLISTQSASKSEKWYRFLYDTVDEILTAYWIIELYLEFTQADFDEFTRTSILNKSTPDNESAFPEIQKNMLEWVDYLVQDIGKYHKLENLNKSQKDYLVTMMCTLIHHFEKLQTKFEASEKCRKAILIKFVRLCDWLWIKKSDYLDYLETIWTKNA
jgi:hypothetical protein